MRIQSVVGVFFYFLAMSGSALGDCDKIRDYISRWKSDKRPLYLFYLDPRGSNLEFPKGCEELWPEFAEALRAHFSEEAAMVERPNNVELLATLDIVREMGLLTKGDQQWIVKHLAIPYAKRRRKSLPPGFNKKELWNALMFLDVDVATEPATLDSVYQIAMNSNDKDIALDATRWLIRQIAASNPTRVNFKTDKRGERLLWRLKDMEGNLVVTSSQEKAEQCRSLQLDLKAAFNGSRLAEPSTRSPISIPGDEESYRNALGVFTQPDVIAWALVKLAKLSHLEAKTLLALDNLARTAGPALVRHRGLAANLIRKHLCLWVEEAFCGDYGKDQSACLRQIIETTLKMRLK